VKSLYQEYLKCFRKKLESIIDKSSSADPIYVKYPYSTAANLDKNVITIHESDLSCLAEGEFLNDNIIDFFLRYLKEEVIGYASEHIHFYSSFFYKKYVGTGTERMNSDDRYAAVKKWTKNVDIFSKSFLVIPVNEQYVF
jgi:Ulp1 family protease